MNRVLAYAFLAAGNNGIRVFDVSDTANPTEVGRYPGKRAGAFEIAVLRVPQVQDAGKLAAARTTTPQTASARKLLHLRGCPAGRGTAFSAACPREGAGTWLKRACATKMAIR